MIVGAAELVKDLDVACDVCVIGSGAGGAVLAAGLAEQGLRVVILEEGGHFTSKHFRALDEAWSFPALYQDRGTRATADLGITVLQGRSVGGGTTVNWTTCFRTPDRVLERWRAAHGLELTTEELAPHFEAVEARLGIARWDAVPPNENNHKLALAADRLGWTWERTRRNVRGCANSGYCGFGCPFDAKQAMGLTYVPDAVAAGATVYSDTRADRVEVVGGRVTAISASVMDPERDRSGPVRIVVRPKVAVLACGAINSPALLLRSGIAGGPVGRRTFLHPVVSVTGAYADPVHAWFGAPQTVTSHDFVDRGPDEYGFFLEHAPVHPMLAGASFPFGGARREEAMAQLANSSSMIALHVDGLLDGDEGGTVTLRGDGRARLDYPVTERLARASRFAHEVMARAHFAAGARQVATLHADARVLSSEADLPLLDSVGYGAGAVAMFSAHQMGGCAMGPDPERSVVDRELRHHRVPNLFVVDGSVLPTALGVNPSETIYGIAHRARAAVGSAV